MWEKYDLYCQRVDMEEQLKRYRRLSADKTNPLAEPYRYYKYGDIEKAAKMLNYLGLKLAAEFERKKALYWKNEAVDLFTGLGLMLYACEKKESKIHMGSIWHIRSYMEIDETKKNGPIFWDFLNTFPDDSAVRQKLSFMHKLHLDPKRQKKKFWGIVKSFDAMMHRYPKGAYENFPHFFLPDYMCHILRAKLKLMGGEELTLDEIFADTPDHILFEFELDEIDKDIEEDFKEMDTAEKRNGIGCELIKYEVYHDDIEIGLLEINEKGQHRYTPVEERMEYIRRLPCRDL